MVFLRRPAIHSETRPLPLPPPPPPRRRRRPFLLHHHHNNNNSSNAKHDMAWKRMTTGGRMILVVVVIIILALVGGGVGRVWTYPHHDLRHGLEFDEMETRRMTGLSCHGLEGMKLLLHLSTENVVEDDNNDDNDDNEEEPRKGQSRLLLLGNEWELLPLWEELKKCGIHVTATVTTRTTPPQKWVGELSLQRRRRRHEKEEERLVLLPSLVTTPNDDEKYDAVMVGPGMWRLCHCRCHGGGGDGGGGEGNESLSPWALRPDSEEEENAAAADVEAIDIFMGGSVWFDDPEDSSCGCHSRLPLWKPSLVVLRDPNSLEMLQQLEPHTQPPKSSSTATTTTTTYLMSGDLGHSFQPLNSTCWNYWMSLYQQQMEGKETILIFSSGSHAANVMSLHHRDGGGGGGGSLELSIVTMNGPTIVEEAIDRIIFVTGSSSYDDNDNDDDRQVVHYQSKEQLCALIFHCTRIYTDQYRPGVIAHRYGKQVTVLEPQLQLQQLQQQQQQEGDPRHGDDMEQEQDMLVRLVELMESPKYMPGSRIRQEYNAKAFHEMFHTLRRLRNRRPTLPVAAAAHNNNHNNINNKPGGGDTVSRSIPTTPTTTTTSRRRSKRPQHRTETLPFAIVVGLPKSGTTSVYHFFSCSGYPTTHYCCCGSNATEYPCEGGKLLSEQLKENLQAGRPLWQGTVDTTTSSSSSSHQWVHAQLDGESERENYFLPQHYHLKELHDSAPDAVWILPLRPAAQWKTSVQKWLDMADRLQVAHDEHEEPDGEDVLRLFDLERFYHLHTDKVRTFCKTHRHSPTTMLCVEVDIEDPEAGRHLGTYFKNTKPSCWGKHNAGPFFQAIPSSS